MANGNAKNQDKPKTEVAKPPVPEAPGEVSPDAEAARLLAGVEAAITAGTAQINGAPKQEQPTRPHYDFETAFIRAGDMMIEAFENNVNRAQGALEQIKATIAKVNEGVRSKAEHLATFEQQMDTLSKEAHAAFSKHIKASEPPEQH